MKKMCGDRSDDCFITYENNGKSYRLPSEAEWEFGCRAGSTTPFCFGETISTDQANYNGNFTYGQGKKGDNRGETTPVGSFSPNAFGRYDTHGNVPEWCSDWYEKYPKGDAVDPQGPTSGNRRVLRGGDFWAVPAFLRSANRYMNSPSDRNGSFGLRAARTFP
jgi:formylglycine-generating enzyme required for sulfatase activity